MKFNVVSEKSMQQLGVKLAQNLSSNAMIELIGDVGAGKTTLVKGIGRGLGVAETIQSPSYTIFCKYDGSEKELHHYDFYRLSEPGLISYDLEESLHTDNAIVVVEWADTVKGVLPPDHISIYLRSIGEHEREVTIEGIDI